MDNIILKAENLNKTFPLAKSGFFDRPEYKQALMDVSISLEKGKVLGIVGESGSGKSTLGRIITRLIVPDSGKIIYNGMDITHMSQKDFAPYRKDIQMIFQNAYSSLNPNKAIGWLLKESLDINTNLSESEKLFKVDEMMDMVGLQKNLKSRYPKELSGGERQRAVIGSALMLRPKIIVADEAVSALDVSICAKILNLMNELKERLDLSYIFISHDLGVVNYLSDTIAILYNGKIVESGSAEEIFKNPKINYTKELLAGTFIYNFSS